MADSSESGGCFGSLASEPNNRSYRNEPEFSLSNWQCTSIACGKVVTAQPRAIINLAKRSVTLAYLEPCNRRPSRSCIPCCRSLDSSCRSFCNRLACPPQKRPCTSLRPESTIGSWYNFSCPQPDR